MNPEKVVKNQQEQAFNDQLRVNNAGKGVRNARLLVPNLQVQVKREQVGVQNLRLYVKRDNGEVWKGLLRGRLAMNTNRSKGTSRPFRIPSKVPSARYTAMHPLFKRGAL